MTDEEYDDLCDAYKMEFDGAGMPMEVFNLTPPPLEDYDCIEYEEYYYNAITTIDW